MDYNLPPTVFAPQQVVVNDPSGAARLFSSIATGRRAFLIVNRGTFRGRLGSDGGVAAANVGFMLRPGEAVALATAAEIWVSNGTYHVMQLAQ